MAEVRSTRLRYISAKTSEALSRAVDSLPFKVEVKGNPVVFKRRIIIYFIIPDHVKDFKNVELDQ